MSNPPQTDDRRPYRARNGSVPDAHTVMPAWMFPYRPSTISRSAAHRIDRVTLPAFNRATQFPLDDETAWRNRWRRMAIFDVCLAVLWAVWMIVLIGVILGA